MEKKTQVEVLVKKTAEVRREQDEFRQSLSLVSCKEDFSFIMSVIFLA